MASFESIVGDFYLLPSLFFLYSFFEQKLYMHSAKELG